MSKSVDPGQITPSEAVWAGSTLFSPRPVCPLLREQQFDSYGGGGEYNGPDIFFLLELNPVFFILCSLILDIFPHIYQAL